MGNGWNSIFKKKTQQETIQITRQQEIQQTQDAYQEINAGQQSMTQEIEKAEPGPAVQLNAVPATKHTKRIGGMSKEERTKTHSDIQRLAFKKNLLENIAMDKKRGFGPDVERILTELEQYAKMNVNALSPEQMIEQEKNLLWEAKERIRSMKLIYENLIEMDQITEKELEELKVINIYHNYLQLDADGLLIVPVGTVEIDCTKKVFEEDIEEKQKVMVRGREVEKKVVVGQKEIEMEDVAQQPLFAHEPSIQDVAQGGLGDCYLLAGLSALISRNPQKIKECMRDNRDGSVTVRFYDKGNAMYVKVAKSIPKGTPYASGCLWVQLMEKAYAASGLHKDTTNPGDKINYSDIAGGLSHVFLERLINQKADTNEFGSDQASMSVDSLYQNIYMKRMHLESGGRTASTELASRYYLGAEASASVETVIFAELQYRMYLQNKFKGMKLNTVEDIDAFLPQLKAEELPDYQDVDQATNQQYKEHFVAAIKQDIEMFKERLLEHKAFSGMYTPNAIDIYEEIEKGEQKDAVMTASTKKEFQNISGEVGLNGEQQEKGLFTTHAYTVLGAKQIGDIKYIKLRNPWAQGTRAYIQDNKTGEISRVREDAGTYGMFLVELNEFVSNFKRYSVL